MLERPSLDLNALSEVPPPPPHPAHYILSIKMPLYWRHVIYMKGSEEIRTHISWT
jgi:hypothetical protein